MSIMPIRTFIGTRAGQQASAGATLNPFAGVGMLDFFVHGPVITLTITTTGYDHTLPGTGIDQVFADDRITIVDPNSLDNSVYDPIQQTYKVQGPIGAVSTILQNLQVTFPGASNDTVVVETDFKLTARDSTGTSSSDTTTTVFTSSPITPSSVYRFFDTSLGTHVYTASAAERDTIKATRPDLVQEPNNFGAVGYGSIFSESVYRFVDTVDGSQFFTASQAEFNAISSTRPDLVFEPANTFFEHSLFLSGDAAVYRFFDTTLGTHFFTGDASEYAGITNQGSASYRADLKYEGIAFYAPRGTYV